jgi:hypothetical protein
VLPRTQLFGADALRFLSRILFFTICWASSAKGLEASECPTFLSPKWFRERSDVKLALARIKTEVDAADLDDDPEYALIETFYVQVMELIHTPRAMEAVRLVDNNSPLIALAQRWVKKKSASVNRMRIAAQTLSRSALRIARNDSAHEVAVSYFAVDDAYQHAVEILDWKLEIPRRALTEGIALSTSFMANPGFFPPPSAGDAVFSKARQKKYEEIFLGWDQLSTSIGLFSRSGWNSQNGARTWIRAQNLYQNLVSLLQASESERALFKTKEPLDLAFFNQENVYLRQLIRETQSALQLIERVLGDLRSDISRVGYREALDDEWKRSKEAAEAYREALTKARGSARVEFEDPYALDADAGPFEQDPVPDSIQREYLNRITALVTNIARTLSPQEIAAEAEHRFNRLPNFNSSPLAHWTVCREVHALTRAGFRRLRIAEGLGLYDGHGTDPKDKISVELGRAQQTFVEVFDRLVQMPCVDEIATNVLNL